MHSQLQTESRVLIRRTPDPRLWTGVAGLVVAVLTLVESSVDLFLVGQRPRLDDGDALVAFMTTASTPTLIVILIDTFLMAFLIVFLAGFRQLITKTRPDVEWIADLAFFRRAAPASRCSPPSRGWSGLGRSASRHCATGGGPARRPQRPKRVVTPGE